MLTLYKNDRELTNLFDFFYSFVLLQATLEKLLQRARLTKETTNFTGILGVKG